MKPKPNLTTRHPRSIFADSDIGQGAVKFNHSRAWDHCDHCHKPVKEGWIIYHSANGGSSLYSMPSVDSYYHNNCVSLSLA